MKTPLSNNRGSALLMVFLVGITIMLLVTVTYNKTSETTRSVKKRKENINAFNIAEAGKEIALADLRSGKKVPFADSTITLFNHHSFGEGHFTVTCEGSVGLDTIILISAGTHGDEEAVIKAICKIVFNTHNVSCSVDAAVTARSEVETLGTITIDGRDWDSTGNSLIGTGVKGIKTLQDVSIGGNSKVGGDSQAPQKNKNNQIVEEYASSVPSTPEEVLGLPANILDSYKTDTIIDLPFDGIWYYSPSGEVNSSPDLSGSRGIFICHNDSYTALLGNYNHNGTFKGIMIIDGVKHFNGKADILGAVISLASTSNSNCFGSGAANIKYSSQVLSELGNISIQDGGTEYNVASWRQIK